MNSSILHLPLSWRRARATNLRWHFYKNDWRIVDISKEIMGTLNPVGRVRGMGERGNKSHCNSYPVGGMGGEED
jgi:hypothetical protein